MTTEIHFSTKGYLYEQDYTDSELYQMKLEQAESERTEKCFKLQ